MQKNINLTYIKIQCYSCLATISVENQEQEKFTNKEENEGQLKINKWGTKNLLGIQTSMNG